MKALASALACLMPFSAFAADEDAIMQKAFRIITQHHLLSRAELACSSLVLEEATKTGATVTVREKHGGKCGGAPETEPRRFTMEIDLKTCPSALIGKSPVTTTAIRLIRKRTSGVVDTPIQGRLP